MLTAIIWGLVQGLTEFLPISSSGHLVLVPAFLQELGVNVEEPALAESAVLHLGTLIAVLVYFRADIARLLRFRTDPGARRLIWLLALGTLPAVIGLPLERPLDRFQANPRNVGLALIGTGIILLIGSRLRRGRRDVDDLRPLDAVVVGVAQAFALISGISRSGTTIVAGMARGLEPEEAARYSFLLGIPAIAGGGLLSLLRMTDGGGVDPRILIGMALAAVSGYAAIALLLAALRRVGLIRFAIYALVTGTVAAIVL